jgi:hypothetical protein
MVSKKYISKKKNSLKNRRYTRQTQITPGLSQKSTMDVQNSSDYYNNNNNSRSWTQITNPKKFSNKRSRNFNNTKKIWTETENLISSLATKINTQAQRSHNNNETSQPIKKEFSMASRRSSDRIKHKFSEIDDKPLSNNFNTYNSISRKEQFINTNKSEECASKNHISSHRDIQVRDRKVIPISNKDSDIEKKVDIAKKGQHQGSDPKSANQMMDHPRSCVPISRSSQDNRHLSTPRSPQFNKKQVQKDGYEKEAKYQLLRPEELGRKEFWHSYANESRSPSFIFCRFQVKKKKMYRVIYKFIKF